jgi:hypothetical protein
MVRSAAASVSTSGVLVTVMPRALAAARSMCSWPAENVAIARTVSGRRSIIAAGQGSVAQVRIALASALRWISSSAPYGRSSALRRGV